MFWCDQFPADQFRLQMAKVGNRCTLDQVPMGSRLTPRLMSEAASSLRLALSVLVRSVIGRLPSLDSMNSSASGTENRPSTASSRKRL